MLSFFVSVVGVGVEVESWSYNIAVELLKQVRGQKIRMNEE